MEVYTKSTDMKRYLQDRQGIFNKKSIKRTYIALMAAAAFTMPLLFTPPAWGGGVVTAFNPENEAKKGGRLDEWVVKRPIGRPEFELVETDTGYALHLNSRAGSMEILGKARYDIKKYPMMRWKWKTERLPKGASSGDFSKNDMAAHISVVFKKWPETINTRRLGYIWDSTFLLEEPYETGVVQSPLSLNTKYIVLRSGTRDAPGEWVSEARNVYKDYRRLFGEEPPGPANISIMIDSDDTRGYAESFIGAIYLSGDPRPSK